MGTVIPFRPKDNRDTGRAIVPASPPLPECAAEKNALIAGIVLKLNALAMADLESFGDVADELLRRKGRGQ